MIWRGLFAGELDKAGLKAGEIITYATPRRLALIAKGLPLETEADVRRNQGAKGRRTTAGDGGFPSQSGPDTGSIDRTRRRVFRDCRKAGSQDGRCVGRSDPRDHPRLPLAEIATLGCCFGRAPKAFAGCVRCKGIVALLGDDVVDCEIDGITSGSATMGHRFHHNGDVTIGNAGDYAAKLLACHVIVDQEERRNIIRAGAEKAASDAGLVLVPDEGLVIENAGLTEWPVPMLGRFDPAFLAVPQEVIQLTARVNQKYFVCHDS